MNSKFPLILNKITITDDKLALSCTSRAKDFEDLTGIDEASFLVALKTASMNVGASGMSITLGNLKMGPRASIERVRLYNSIKGDTHKVLVDFQLCWVDWDVKDITALCDMVGGRVDCIAEPAQMELMNG